MKICSLFALLIICLFGSFYSFQCYQFTKTSKINWKKSSFRNYFASHLIESPDHLSLRLNSANIELNREHQILKRQEFALNQVSDQSSVNGATSQNNKSPKRWSKGFSLPLRIRNASAILLIKIDDKIKMLETYMKKQEGLKKRSLKSVIFVSMYTTLMKLRRPRNLLQIILIVVSIMGWNSYYRRNRSIIHEISYGDFIKVLSGTPQRLGGIRATQNTLAFTMDGKKCITRLVNLESGLLYRLILSGVDFSAIHPPTNVLGMVWSAVYLFVVYNLYTRMIQGPKDESVGKSKEDINLSSFGSLTFDDIAGQDKAKLEVKEICDMLKAPEVYARLGARVPSGVLLTGPPGTGKTLLARITATASNVPFISCSATEFVEVFVGRGPARIRQLFKKASKIAPCIIFIDEIDSIGRSRRSGNMNSEQESTLNQLLTCMDGLDTSNNGVIVMAATNRAELLDSALLRPGRFDRLVQCPPPDKDGRYDILLVHTKKLSLDANVNLEIIAGATNGFSGADLANIVNEAAIRTVRRQGLALSQQDFYEALRSYFDGRGVSLGSIANWSIPSWLKDQFRSTNIPGETMI